MNIMMLLEMAAEAFGDRVAIGDKTKGMTYSGLAENAGKTAAWLREQNAGRLIYVDESSPTLPVALFGSSWAGKPFVPVSYRLQTDRLNTLIERQAPAVVVGAANVGSVVSQADGLKILTNADFGAAWSTSTPPSADWSSEPEDIAVLLHTSGTSGDPKIAVLRQRHLVSYVLGSCEFMSAEEDEASLVSVPPYHIAGISAMLTGVYQGRRIVQLPAFEENEWVRLAREQEITHAMVVPTMLARILEVLEDGKGLPTLRHLSYGGGRMPLPIIERAMELIPNVNFVNAYGLTETSSSISILGPDDHRDAMASEDPAIRKRLGSVGRPLPSVEITIRDEDGKEVPTGTSGEVWVRGEQVSGEYAKQGSTSSDEGWFQTKDGGYFDDGGFLFVEGRIDDVIVKGGENLSPGEIEDVLLDHPSVREVCVVGLPDVEWGEIVAAVIVPAEGTKCDDDELKQWVAKHLRSSRVPALFEYRIELPYNDTGKVLRRVIREELKK